MNQDINTGFIDFEKALDIVTYAQLKTNDHIKTYQNQKAIMSVESE